jgi:hypothetical protein
MDTNICNGFIQIIT